MDGTCAFGVGFHQEEAVKQRHCVVCTDSTAIVCDNDLQAESASCLVVSRVCMNI